MTFTSPWILTIWVLGGLSILIYGMQLASDGLQRVGGSRLHDILKSMVRNRFTGALVGIIVTVMVQSSSATTVMLIGFVNAGLMTLKQTIGVILGSDIGTTVTVQLISLQLTDYSPLLIAVGFLLTFRKGNAKTQYAGRAVMGFGFIFLGMYMMGATKSMTENEAAKRLFLTFGENPALGVLAATLFTGIVQSSAATIGLAISLSVTGVLSLEAAIPLMLGANIGTCATALLASIGGTRTALRVAVSHTAFKIIGVLVFFPFIGPFTELASHTATDLARQVANAHTLFNLAVTVLFLPFVGPFVKAVERFVPEQKERMPGAVKHLDPILLGSPEVAIGQAGREILSSADKVQKLMELVEEVVFRDNENVIGELRGLEDEVDIAARETILYLTKLSQKNLTEEQSRQTTRFLFIADELEHIGDNVESVLRQAQKKLSRNIRFSDEGRLQLRKMFDEVKLILVMTINAMVLRDKDLARKAYKTRGSVREMHREFNLAHFQRLMDSRKESIESSSIHLDLLDRFERVNVHVTRIAHIIMDETSTTPREHV